MTDKKQMAADLGLDPDPLEQYSDYYNDADVDPFEYYIDEIVRPKGPAGATLSRYQTHIKQYKAYMARHDRHFACPTESHIKGFLTHLTDERGNDNTTALQTLRTINAAFRYWQNDPHFPHPADHNPIEMAKQKLDLSREQRKPPHYISRATLRDEIHSIKNTRDRVMVVLMLKLGLRAGELCNIKLRHINISADTVNDYYDDLGASPHIESYPNAIYIPSDIDGNKSKRPRLLPLDEETRIALRQYLLIRPDNGEPWLMLTQTHQHQLEPQDINRTWEKHFRPKYDETEQYRALTSHFGRHYFTNFWKSKENLSRTYVKYMRGDKTNEGAYDEGIDHYLHGYYPDIEPIYRKRIYQFDLSTTNSPSSTA